MLYLAVHPNAASCRILKRTLNRHPPDEPLAELIGVVGGAAQQNGRADAGTVTVCAKRVAKLVHDLFVARRLAVAEVLVVILPGHAYATFEPARDEVQG
ncbi:MAG: hypothetical protein EXQ94_13680 [Alphaproteobacteria bacterium]|nr:hypothetical protein [Alphaproteobacteria bacterium]